MADVSKIKLGDDIFDVKDRSVKIKAKSSFGLFNAGDNIESIAVVDDGYEFLCWLQPSTVGWFPMYPIYISDPTQKSSTVWSASGLTNDKYVLYTYLIISKDNKGV